ncbi:hypothetical protein EK904_009862 [Melospiza melodia maxima]|nr:hypothetical protein EK904_009862 [Melospiza melodia maxima]
MASFIGKTPAPSLSTKPQKKEKIMESGKTTKKEAKVHAAVETPKSKAGLEKKEGKATKAAVQDKPKMKQGNPGKDKELKSPAAMKNKEHAKVKEGKNPTSLKEKGPSNVTKEARFSPPSLQKRADPLKVKNLKNPESIREKETGKRKDVKPPTAFKEKDSSKRKEIKASNNPKEKGIFTILKRFVFAQQLRKKSFGNTTICSEKGGGEEREQHMKTSEAEDDIERKLFRSFSTPTSENTHEHKHERAKREKAVSQSKPASRMFQALGEFSRSRNKESKLGGHSGSQKPRQSQQSMKQSDMKKMFPLQNQSNRKTLQMFEITLGKRIEDHIKNSMRLQICMFEATPKISGLILKEFYLKTLEKTTTKKQLKDEKPKAHPVWRQRCPARDLPGRHSRDLCSPQHSAQDQQGPPSLLLCSLIRDCKVHLQSLSGALARSCNIFTFLIQVYGARFLIAEICLHFKCIPEKNSQIDAPVRYFQCVFLNGPNGFGLQFPINSPSNKEEKTHSKTSKRKTRKPGQ